MLWSLLALASPPPPGLFAEGGWSPHNERHGVTVQAKVLDGRGRTAFRGIYPLPDDVDLETLFAVINDIEGAVNIGDRLEESRLLSSGPSGIAFYQVLRDPLGPVAARWWLNTAQVERDLDGVVGHHRRTWQSADADTWLEARADIQARYPDAVEVGGTWGAWEVVPATRTLIYTTLTDPGGKVPDALYTTVSGRTLPDNMLDFVQTARDK